MIYTQININDTDKIATFMLTHLNKFALSLIISSAAFGAALLLSQYHYNT